MQTAQNYKIPHRLLTVQPYQSQQIKQTIQTS